MNIVLDPILIYGWFGVNAMGVKGAAYATVIGQIAAFLLAYYFHKKYNKHISGSLKGFRPDITIIKRIYTILLTVIGTVLFEVFAVQITSAFGLSGSTMELCIKAIQIISLSFVFVGINVAAQTVFQSVGSGMESLVVSFLRQIVLVLPVAYAFTELAMRNADYTWMIWFTFIIAEGITAIVSLVYMKGIYIKKICTM